ncbi:U2-type spliceosomal complex subunit CWC21 Ecym_2554 [Eremothecium cymbalariae DBVPG|uniref:Pre-mRNA-splicing factor CWC21 n=1 Tax=Eremothecium cymbalariae (strain CBS 270.75 / DBVPG 7215 / KCTC 17166 / NRRL Y-17582) TaxID=931890 RepID=G8JQB6_ERECY|nr:Hypothetical protein Ecym_2554 [Eremothecium cymbalariae DBVPG\
MSYNGIGLKSSKGSSTSGHIQRSLADNEGKKNVKNFLARQEKSNGKRDVSKGTRAKTVDDSILKRLDRRQVELQVSELRDQLEDAGNYDENEITRKCDELRDELQKQLREHDRVRTVYTTRKKRTPAVGDVNLNDD